MLFRSRHHCYAYMLGAEKTHFRANDGGEPNHSAGDPILGQIRSADLTNVLVVVVRYFGGVKLGVGGLITAYKKAAADALAQAEVVEMHETRRLQVHFPYEAMNEVMSVVKTHDLALLHQHFDLSCQVTLEVRKQHYDQVKHSLEQIPQVYSMSE